jgi:hypothetical protein
MKEKPKGGIRKGAGRKPTNDPKMPVTLFIEMSTINSKGGKDGVKGYLYSCLENQPVINPDKKFPPSDDEIKQKGLSLPKDYVKVKKLGAFESDGTVLKGATKPAGVLKPQERPKKTIAHSTTFDEKGRITEDLKIQRADSAKPKNLDELKAICPYPEKSEERSNWVRTERQKYGI